MTIIDQTVRELEMFYENDYELYQLEQEWVKNYARKVKAGRYNHQMAVKGIAQNFIPKVIQKYRKSYSLPQISMQQKIFMAERWVNTFEQKLKDREYSEEIY